MHKRVIILILLAFSIAYTANGSRMHQPATAFLKDKERDSAGEELINIMQKVLDWQIAHFTYLEEGNLHDYGLDAWTNGVLYLGATEFAKIAYKGDLYDRWLLDIGQKSGWHIPANFSNNPRYSLYHADELCIAQFYLQMYEKYGDSTMIASTKERLDWIMAHPPGSDMSHRGKQSWTWCDALFMAPPVYAHIAQITKDERYLLYMHQEYAKTYKHLFDTDENLFFRDDSYLEKREANGTKIFWGRGNGWVVAGIANLLKTLPENDPKKDFYVDLYRKMIIRLAELRGEDHFWHASLLDPDSYPAPEASATAMIVYAMAYGVNNDYLDKETYLPIIESSWQALLSIINEEGKLGFVQPIGADPKKVTEDMSAVYGVGAFLLAGVEIYHMNND